MLCNAVMDDVVMLDVARLYGRKCVLYTLNSLRIDVRGSERLERGSSSAEIHMCKLDC